MCKLCIPICISCCFTIMMQSPVEGANTEKGQEVLKHFSSSPDRYNGVSNLLPNFLWLNIDNNFRENAFKLGIDNVFEFFRGSEVISPSVNNEATQNREHNTNEPLSPDREREKQADEFFHSLFLYCLLGAIIKALLAR